MTTPDDESGILTVLIERFERQHLPRLLDIQNNVERGERLADYDVDFLQLVLSESEKIRALIVRHPEYEMLASKVVGLYREITEKALANEGSPDDQA
jgi:hypothetical protein